MSCAPLDAPALSQIITAIATMRRPLPLTSRTLSAYRIVADRSRRKTAIVGPLTVEKIMARFDQREEAFEKRFILQQERLRPMLVATRC
jgi:hypothetical protein